LRVTQNSSKLGGINGSLQLANQIKSFLDRDLIGCSAPDMLGLFTSGQKPIHLTDLSVGEYSARISTSTLRDSVNILALFTFGE
jgi:hypothetical protein